MVSDSLLGCVFRAMCWRTGNVSAEILKIDEITPADILAEYPDVFEGIGCLLNIIYR